MTGQSIELPFPPTANTMWRTGGRGMRQRKVTYLSEAYRRWKDDAGQRLILQRPTRVEGPVRIVIGLNKGTKHRWDIDNRVKPVLDLLASHLVIEDDDYTIVREITVHYDPDIVGAHVTIIPTGA